MTEFFPHAVHFYFKSWTEIARLPSLLAISTDAVKRHPSKAGHPNAHYMRPVQLPALENILVLTSPHFRRGPLGLFVSLNPATSGLCTPSFGTRALAGDELTINCV